MLETIREYARELLEQSEDPAELRDRHLALCLEFVERAEPELTGPDQRGWYERLALEQDNIREALAYACDTGDGERALMLAGTIWRFWWNHGYIEEGAHWYERAFAVGEPASAKARARALVGVAHLDESRGDVGGARRHFEEAARLLRSIGETRWLIVALMHLVGLTHELGDRDRAARLSEEARVLAEESGDIRGASLLKLNEASRLLDETGDPDLVRSSCEEALERLRAIGDSYGVASALNGLAEVALRSGDTGAACAHLRESIELSRSIGDAQTLGFAFALVAAAAFERRYVDASAALWGAREALCKAHGFDTGVEPWLDEIRTATRMHEESADAAWATGLQLDLDAAVRRALEPVAA
jgi:tetratricopeptide (TPR) repeat protein